MQGAPHPPCIQTRSPNPSSAGGAGRACAAVREADTHTHAVTLVGEDGLGQGGRGGSHAGRGAAGSDTGGSSEPRILTDLREGAESAGQR